MKPSPTPAWALDVDTLQVSRSQSLPDLREFILWMYKLVFSQELRPLSRYLDFLVHLAILGSAFCPSNSSFLYLSDLWSLVHHYALIGISFLTTIWKGSTSGKPIIIRLTSLGFLPSGSWFYATCSPMSEKSCFVYFALFSGLQRNA